MTSPEADPDVAAALGAALEAAGAPRDAAVVVGPPRADAPVPPEGPWVLVPYGAAWAVGAVDRGSFAAYGVLEDADTAVALAVTLCTTRAASAPAPDEADLLERGRRTGQGISSRTSARGGRPGPAGLVAGDVLDLVGPETARHLYALGTPFPERAQPPSDVGRSYHRYEVRGPLPAGAAEGLAAPWFGQPGGGAKVVLDAPVRRYVDAGLLVELVQAG